MFEKIGTITFGLLFFLSLPLWADPSKLELTADIETRYTDNVFFDIEDPVDDFILRASPGIQGGWDAEDVSLEFSGKAHFYHYREYDELNAVDQLYSGRLNRQWSDRFSTALSADFLIDERRDRELAETGLLFDDDRRWRQSYGLSGQYALSELSSVDLSYTFQVEDFENETHYDSGIHRVQALFSRSLASFLENCIGRIQAVGGFYEYRRDYDSTGTLVGFPVDIKVEDRQNIDYYSLSLGLGYQWTEKLNLTFDMGARLTRNKQRVSNEFSPNPYLTSQADEEENESTGYVAMLTADYRGEKGGFSMLASHDLVPSSGQDGTTERSTLRLAVDRRLTLKWSCYGSARAYLNRSDDSRVTSDDDELTLELKTGLRYALHPRWRIGADWRTYWIEDRQEHVDRYQNTMTLMLQWNWPVLD
jgi:hypothetical protein